MTLPCAVIGIGQTKHAAKRDEEALQIARRPGVVEDGWILVDEPQTDAAPRGHRVEPVRRDAHQA